jgi:hypothetical protein
MLQSLAVTRVTAKWLSEYKAANRERLRQLPDFANWLESDYVPIVGGWQY